MTTYSIFDDSARNLTYTWAKGLTFNADGSISGGYYDVHKVWGGVDDYMCWAASASNIIAWWQQLYDTTSTTPGTEPEDVTDIFSTIKQYWSNDGNSAESAFVWWLAGSGTNISYSYSGGYYNQYYDDWNIESSAYYCGLVGTSATSTADILTGIFENGGMVSLGVNHYDGVNLTAGHAVTLWGVTTDEDTGHLTAIHLTDSDDHNDGVFTVQVRYNEANQCYEALNNRYDNYYLAGISVLTSFQKEDTTSPAAPTGGAVKVQGQNIVFSWDALSDESGVFYDVLYQHEEAMYCEIVSTTSNSLTVTSATAGSYHWWLRARDLAGNVSSEIYFGSFVYTATTPVFTYQEPSVTKLKNGRAEVTFIWQSSQSLTYELRVNGALVYSGSDCSYNQTMSDGVYEFTITAKNGAGYTTSRGGTLVCDTVAPPMPTNLKVTLNGKQAVFSWTGGQDASGISYTIAYRLKGTDKYTYSSGITEESMTLMLPQDGEYEWFAYATDGTGQSSATVWGGDFVCGMALTLEEPEQKKTAEGKSQVVFRWSSNSRVDCTLEIGGKSYTGSGKTGTLTVTLADGSYDYTFSARDAAGNSSDRSGSLTCDTMAPPVPSALKAELQQQGKQVLLTWQAVEDVSGVSYELEWRRQGQTAYTTETSTTARFTLSLPAEAFYEWRVRAVDGAGQASAWAEGAEFSNDVTAPQLELAAPVQKKTGANKTQVSFSWTCSEAATYTLEINGKTTSLGSTLNYALTLADGEYSYKLTATDSSGKSSVQRGSITCDTMAPPVPTALKAQVQTDGTRAVLSWQAVEDVSGVSYELQWRLKGETAYTTETCQVANFALTLPNESLYEWRVRAVDGLGQASAWSEGGAFSSDAVAPELRLEEPVLTGTETGKTRVSFRWSADEPATFCLEIDGRTIDLGTSGSYSLVLADGSYDYGLIATDASGNVSEKRGSLICDATPPDRPSGLSVRLRGSQFRFSWQGVEDVSGVSYELCLVLPSGKEEVYRISSGQSYTMTPPVEGRYNWSLRAVDGKGQASAWVDGPSTAFGNIPPQLTLLEPQQEKAGEGLVRVTLRWSSTDEVSYALEIDGESVELADDATAWTGVLADGEHRYMVSVRDAAGNTASQTGEFRFDATAPTLISTTPALTKEGVLRWEGEAGTTYCVKIDKLAEVNVGSATEYAPAQLSQGKHSYVITASDGSNETTVKGSFTLDSVPVELTAGKNSVKRGKKDELATATLAWKGESGATYHVFLDGEELSDEVGTTKTSFKVPGVEEGDHTYTIRATDKAGNVSELTGTLHVDTYAPVLTLNAPATMTKDEVPTLSWVGIAGESYTLKVGKETVNFEGAGEHQYTFAAKDGKYSYTLTAVDLGNNKTSAKGSFTRDTIAPKLSISSAKAAKVVAGELELTLAWKGESKASYSLSIGDEVYDTAKTSQKLTLEGGYHDYELSAFDQAGNETTILGSLYVDTVAKKVTLLERAEAAAASGLDRELTLSAGTYCLPVSPAGNAALGSCTLDLEAEENGSMQPMHQACLASLA